MACTLLPSTSDVKETFTVEVEALGGTVSDAYEDGNRLYLRALLPSVEEVRRGDAIQGGVALRTLDDEILVHPYTFRQICRNGAIRARALDTRRVERVDFAASSDAVEHVLQELRTVVADCSSRDVFLANLGEIRSAAEREADVALHLFPLLSRMTQHMLPDILGEILGRFEAGRDRSAFGLMNAVTSTARDRDDADLRWRLEELGGAIPAGRPSPRPDRAAARLVPVP